jgi:uroporphyrinogen III methyltransferase/synthase
MRVVITRPRDQAGDLAEALEACGFTPIFFPTIRIAPATDPRPLDAALERLSGCDWVVFTSANAVEAVWERLDRLGLAFPAKVRVAAVGPKTAARLRESGVTADFVPDEYVSEAIVPGLGDLAGKRVFLPLGDLAGDALARAVAAGGGIPDAVTAYRTLPAGADPDGLAALQDGVYAVTFTSGSTAVNFATLVRTAGRDPFRLPGDPLIVCIGPKTAAAAQEAGFRVDRVADEYTLEGLVSALTGVTA